MNVIVSEYMCEIVKDFIKTSILMKEIVHDGADIRFAHLC